MPPRTRHSPLRPSPKNTLLNAVFLPLSLRFPWFLRPLTDMTARIAKTAVLLVAAFTFALQGLSPFSIVPASSAAPAQSCCSSGCGHCGSTACCARPADNRAPVTPAVPRCASSQEWLAIAPAPTRLLTLSRSPLNDLSQAPAPIQAGAVPIFQRNCSFLL
jgi:hypothetical protein